MSKSEESIKACRIEHLNRPYGYEIALILADKEMTKEEIKEEINEKFPYDEPDDKELCRVINDGNTNFNVGIFTDPPLIRGKKRYKLRSGTHSVDLIEVAEKAIARIIDNLDETEKDTGSTITPELIDKVPEAIIEQWTDALNINESEAIAAKAQNRLQVHADFEDLSSDFNERSRENVDEYSAVRQSDNHDSPTHEQHHEPTDVNTAYKHANSSKNNQHY